MQKVFKVKLATDLYVKTIFGLHCINYWIFVNWV